MIMKTNLIAILLTSLCLISAAVKADEVVGTPHGEFSVSPLGGATYSLEIECPKGVRGMEPKISLTYNSQSGYGLAGYGTTVSGISSITVGGRDHYHEHFTKGVLFDGHDAFYLDGKRLMADSAVYLPDANSYTIEGDPYTSVTVHGTLNDQTADLWFEVHDRNGMTYKYGETQDSRLSYTNKSGKPRISTWYISSAEDASSNYITYNYIKTDNVVRPSKISYGGNKTAGTQHCNEFVFAYESLGATAQPFVIEGCQGNISQRLKSITTKTDGSVYRTYNLAYNSVGDGSKVKYARLVSVTESNGANESMRPVTFQWNYLQSANVNRNDLNISLDDANSLVEKQDMNLMSADLNGDGVDDIIRISQVKIYANSLHNAWNMDTYVYISRSQIGEGGSVTYSSPIRCALGAQLSWDDLISIQGGVNVLDYDGDGINDLLIPRYENSLGSQYVKFYFIFGKDVVNGNIRLMKMNGPLTASGELPLIASCDVSNDGFDDIVFIEKGMINGGYPLKIVYPTGTDMHLETIDFSVNLPNTPQKLFAGDYNHDGLTDIIIFHDDGYKIYYNRGGTVGEQKFYEWASSTGTNVRNSWRMVPGDFNADGIPDFVVNVQNEWNLHFALSNGDGTFTYQMATTLPVVDKNTGRDDERYNIQVMDIDHDGRSDVIVMKEDLEYHGGLFNDYYEFTETYIGWFLSNGSTLEQLHTQTTSGIDDANQRYATVGDFDGDGCQELLHYGKNIYGSNSIDETKLHIYKSGTGMASKGHVCKITDGLGRTTFINYISLTDTSTYRKIGDLSYPVVEKTIPLSVVKNVTRSNGAAGINTTYYKYSGLKFHVKGKGLLGFTGTTVTNNIFNSQVEVSVVQWDSDKWIPTKNRTVTRTGNSTSMTETTYGFFSFNNNTRLSANYFTYPQTVSITDEYGNITTTTSTYDAEKGVPVTVNESWDGGTYYTNTTYSNYVKKGGRYLPQRVSKTQKHPDDPSSWTSTDIYIYNNKGLAGYVSTFNGTSASLKKYLGYDTFGNIRWERSYGNNVTPGYRFCTYDTSGRFLNLKYTEPATSRITYTRDIWGNVIQEQEIGSNTLTTTYSYDSWGRLMSSTSPEGVVTSYTEGWGTTSGKKYWKKVSTTGQPWVKTWYDSEGREVLSQTIGPKQVEISKSITYNGKGNRVYESNRTGNLTIIEHLSYDSEGRVVRDSLSTGRTTAYSYGNRSVTSTVNGHVYTKTFDAWGNVMVSEDPVASVSYSYGSNALPKSVSCEGATISMEYDQAGRRTSIDDPDAGETNFTWSADGKLMSKTDARGIETTNSYNSFGCLTTKQCGDHVITNTYGTNSSDKLRLMSTAMNGKTINYSYDTYNRITSETRTLNDNTSLSFSYSYNDEGLHSQTVYPGGLTVGYVYDDYGNLSEMTANGQTVYSHKYFDGKKDSVLYLGSIGYASLTDSNGNLVSQKWSRNSSAIDSRTYEVDGATGNLMRRSHKDRAMPNHPLNSGSNSMLQAVVPLDSTLMPPPDAHLFGFDTFQYDALDRLTVFAGGLFSEQDISYSPNGNIIRKHSLGDYVYDATTQPHAVKTINSGETDLDSDIETTFGDLNKIETIEKGDLCTTFEYGPDEQRWYSVMTKNDTIKRTVIYAQDYERVTQNGVTREFYYIGHGVVIMKQNGTFTPLVAMSDHQGSILFLVDGNGTKKFDAEYDPWGSQTVYKNTIAFQRGYTGHEMLPEYGLINMNGRLYDPQIGRFLSPDNYVQEPYNSQSFNRYSYCLNNPLKYTDPDGEFWHIIIGGVIGGTINLVSKAINGQINNFGDGLAAFGIGFASGSIASASGVAMLGMMGGSTSVASGFAVGSFSSVFSLPALSIGNSTYFGDPIMGASDYIKGVILGGVAGAVTNAVSNALSGKNIWTGKVTPKLQEVTPLPNEVQGVSISGGVETEVLDSPDYLFHYTSESGYHGIMESQEINPSIGIKHARYGDGVYLTDLNSKELTAGQLSQRLYRVPWNTHKVQYFIKIDVKGLNVIGNSPYNFRIPTNSPVPINGRIVDSGLTIFKINF